MPEHDPLSKNLMMSVDDGKSGPLLLKLQDTISEIFESSLKKRPSLNDDYFELGGTSLGLIFVISEISNKLNIVIDPGIIMNGLSVAALAQSIEVKLNCLERPS